MRTPNSFLVEQPYSSYTEEDHRLWGELYTRQEIAMCKHGCRKWIMGMAYMPMDGRRVPVIREVSENLRKSTGWTLACVDGLIGSQDFFKMLSERVFPVAWKMRKAHERDYLAEPDIFHDLFGHVPLLAHEDFADFMQNVGVQGLALVWGVDDPKHQDKLASILLRLYWFTVEFGLIEEDDRLKIFGAGIASSHKEIENVIKGNARKLVLHDIERACTTRYKIDHVQPLYFVADDFEQMKKLISQDSFYEEMLRLRHQALSDPLETLPMDREWSITQGFESLKK